VAYRIVIRYAHGFVGLSDVFEVQSRTISDAFDEGRRVFAARNRAVKVDCISVEPLW